MQFNGKTLWLIVRPSFKGSLKNGHLFWCTPSQLENNATQNPS